MSTAPNASFWSLFRDANVQKATQLITLAAIYSSISQLTLSPVYGSIPSAFYHKYGSTAAALLAVSLPRSNSRSFLKRLLPALPIFAFWIPSIQFILFKYSSWLGNPSGPLVTELLTFYPLLILSLYIARVWLHRADTSGFDKLVPEISFPFYAFAWFLAVQRLVRRLFFRNMGSFILMNRVILQLVIALAYSMLLPDNVFWPCVPTAAFSMIGNVHNPLVRTTDVLNNTLSLYDYTLLARRESVTGYISVLESKKERFRVMRCDHSLLGGAWTIPPQQGHTLRVHEPIFAVFAMLEAVRLVETSPGTDIPDSERKALNVGLGIGTAPGALITHGIDTTIIEIDPVIHEYAQTYFNFPSNHTAAIGDAVAIVAQSAHQASRPKYDYIIHDVFTGGAEPVELFTFEFLSDLALLLAEDGVIAINYAGELTSPITSLIYRTVVAVFPSCRIFREDDPAHSTTALINMAIFCKKSSGALSFRNAVEQDFLGSGARRESLPPRFEISPQTFQADGDVLWQGQVGKLRRSQTESAINHWKVMRTVIPSTIWENW